VAVVDEYEHTVPVVSLHVPEALPVLVGQHGWPGSPQPQVPLVHVP
jgi:hypothetical protein